MIYDSWDLTFEETEKGAFNVGQKWGKVGPDRYLLAQIRRRMGFTDQVPAVLNLRASNVPHGVLVEKAANGAALLAVLRKKVPGLIAIKPLGSKFSRAEACSPQIEAGNVYLPDPEVHPWVIEFIKEWSLVPNGAFWDQVDAASQALNKFGGAVNYDWKPESMTQASKFMGM